VPCANRANRNNLKPVKLPEGYSGDLSEFMGILLGDGGVTTYFVRIYLNAEADRAYAPRVMYLARNLFPGASVTSYKDRREKSLEIQISSKTVSDYLRGVGFSGRNRTVPAWILDRMEYTKKCLRGLFDTEGSVGLKVFHGKGGNYLYKQLTFTNKSQGLLNFVHDSLKTLGFNPTAPRLKNIYISNSKDIQRFINEIGFSNPKLLVKSRLQSYNDYLQLQGGLA